MCRTAVVVDAAAAVDDVEEAFSWLSGRVQQLPVVVLLSLGVLAVCFTADKY